MNRRQKSSSNPDSSGVNGPRMRSHLGENRSGNAHSANSGAIKVGQHVAPSTTNAELGLIQQMVANDPKAQEELFKMCAPKLYRTAFAILRNKQDAEDAVQDSWLRAYSNLNSFEGRSSFSTWLTRIAINSALMIVRKNRCARTVSVEDLEQVEEKSLNLRPSDTSQNPEQACVDHERKTLLNVAIRSLRPRLRSVVELKQLRELSLSETACELGISIEAVKTRSFQARTALRRSLALRGIARAKSEVAA